MHRQFQQKFARLSRNSEQVKRQRERKDHKSACKGHKTTGLCFCVVVLDCQSKHYAADECYNKTDTSYPSRKKADYLVKGSLALYSAAFAVALRKGGNGGLP